MTRLTTINSNDYNGTTTIYENGFVPNPFWKGEKLTSLLAKCKDKKIGEIPENTHVYTRILKYWLMHTLGSHIYMYPYVRNNWAGKIIIVEGIADPIEFWNHEFRTKDLYISQEWLKKFITTEELAELAAIRMEESK